MAYILVNQLLECLDILLDEPCSFFDVRYGDPFLLCQLADPVIRRELAEVCFLVQ
jgi:hypothetical protein